MESSQSWMRIESWRTAKRTGRSTNATYDRIDNWSQHKPWNGTDETQWAVLIRSEPMRSLIAILEQCFVCLTRPYARQHYFWGMWCIFVCHTLLTSIILCTAVWAQACGLEHKTSFVMIVHLWFIRRLPSFTVVGVLVGAVSRYCHFWYRTFGPSQP